MKKLILLLFFLYFSACFGQNKRVTIAFEGKFNTFYPLGNNFLNEGLGDFMGFGFSSEVIFIKNFGLGIEYGQSYSKVTNESVYGTLRDPVLRVYQIFAVYNYPFNEKTELEGKLGYSAMNISTKSNFGFGFDDFREGGKGLILGGKLFYSIVQKPNIQIFLSPNIQFYRANNDYFSDEKINNFYTKSTLLNLNAGLRLNIYPKGKN